MATHDEEGVVKIFFCLRRARESVNRRSRVFNARPTRTTSTSRRKIARPTAPTSKSSLNWVTMVRNSHWLMQPFLNNSYTLVTDEPSIRCSTVC